MIKRVIGGESTVVRSNVRQAKHEHLTTFECRFVVSSVVEKCNWFKDARLNI